MAQLSQVENLERGYRGTSKTIDKMHRLVAHGKLDPEIQRIATLIRLSVDRDDRGRSRELADAVFDWVRRHGKFQRDPLQIEKLETPRESMRHVVEARRSGAYQGPALFAGDCDTFAIWVASLGGILGYEYAFETVKVDPRRPKEFSHVYAALRVGNEMVPYDASSTIAQPGWRPSVPENRLKVWNEPLIEKTVKNGQLNGNGLGFWPDEPGYIPEDYQGYGLPKVFPGDPVVPDPDPGVIDVQIPETPAIPRDEIASPTGLLTRRRALRPDQGRVPMDPQSYFPRPKYTPKRPYYSQMVPYPPKWPHARQERIVMSQPFAMDRGAGRDYDVTEAKVIPTAGYEGLGLPPGFSLDPSGRTVTDEQAAQKKEDTEKSVGDTVVDALKGLIASAPDIAKSYYERKLVEAKAKVAQASDKVTARDPQLLYQGSMPSVAAWYKNPWVWAATGAVVIGGYLLTRTARRRNPPRRRKYRLSGRGRKRAA